jgi:hypothetical protein
MTVIMGSGLFEDRRAAQDHAPRAVLARAGRHGRRCDGEAGPPAKRIPVRDGQLGAAVLVGAKAQREAAVRAGVKANGN